MLRTILVPLLEQRFRERGLRTGVPPDPIATIPAVHEAVGDVTVWDDGDEATVAIGTITHGHFGAVEAELGSAQAAERIAADVIGFLDDLFADKVLLWKCRDSDAGGWRMLHGTERPSYLDSDDLTFLWSGPVPNPVPREAR